MSRMSENIFGDDWYISMEAQAARQTRPSAVAFHMRQTFPLMLAGADWCAQTSTHSELAYFIVPALFLPLLFL